MDFDCIVIGAGVTGLAVAAELAPRGGLLILDRADGYGHGVSSRSSEVVHAGIYYRPGCLKARLCVEGRRILERWAAAGHFGYRRTGKFLIAVEPAERAALAELLLRGRANGAGDLREAELDELTRAVPGVRAIAALWSPDSAVLDSHGLMRFLAGRATAAGANLLLRTQVVGLRAVDGGFAVAVADAAPVAAEAREAPLRLPRELPVQGPRQTVTARCVVNAAGLYADQVAALAGIAVEAEGLRQYWSRGEYFAPPPGRGPRPQHLVYPVPPADGTGHLGIHATVDLAGGVRFGPSAEWADPPHLRSEDYRQDGRLRAAFAAELRRWLPAVDGDALEPAGVGIRPRRFGPGAPAADFYVQEETARGLPGLVNLIGIESPGLTAAPAIARAVATRLS